MITHNEIEFQIMKRVELVIAKHEILDEFERLDRVELPQFIKDMQKSLIVHRGIIRMYAIRIRRFEK